MLIICLAIATISLTAATRVFYSAAYDLKGQVDMLTEDNASLQNQIESLQAENSDCQNMINDYVSQQQWLQRNEESYPGI